MLSDVDAKCFNFLLHGHDQALICQTTDSEDINKYKNTDYIRYKLCTNGYISHSIASGLVRWDYTAKGIYHVRDLLYDVLELQTAAQYEHAPTGTISSVLCLLQVLGEYQYKGKIVCVENNLPINEYVKYNQYCALHRYYPNPKNKSVYYIIDPMVIWMENQLPRLWKIEGVDEIILQHKTFSMISFGSFFMSDFGRSERFLKRELVFPNDWDLDNVLYEYDIYADHAKRQRRTVYAIPVGTRIGEQP